MSLPSSSSSRMISPGYFESATVSDSPMDTSYDLPNIPFADDDEYLEPWANKSPENHSLGTMLQNNRNMELAPIRYEAWSFEQDRQIRALEEKVQVMEHQKRQMMMEIKACRGWKDKKAAMEMQVLNLEVEKKEVEGMIVQQNEALAAKDKEIERLQAQVGYYEFDQFFVQQEEKNEGFEEVNQMEVWDMEGNKEDAENMEIRTVEAMEEEMEEMEEEVEELKEKKNKKKIPKVQRLHNENKKLRAQKRDAEKKMRGMEKDIANLKERADPKVKELEKANQDLTKALFAKDEEIGRLKTMNADLYGMVQRSNPKTTMNPEDLQSPATQGQNAPRELFENPPPRMPSSLPEVHALPQEHNTFHSSSMSMGLNQSEHPSYPPCNCRISEAGYVERIGRLEAEIRRKDADAELNSLRNSTATRGPGAKRRREESMDSEGATKDYDELKKQYDAQKFYELCDKSLLKEKQQEINNLEKRILLLESGDEALQAEMRKNKILEKERSEMLPELDVLREGSNARIRVLEKRNNELEGIIHELRVQKERADEQIEQLKNDQKNSGSKLSSENPVKPKIETNDDDEYNSGQVEKNQKLEKKDGAMEAEKIRKLKTNLQAKDARILESQEIADLHELQRQLEEKDKEIARLMKAHQTRESRDATLQELREDYQIIMEKNDELEKQVKRLEDELEKKNQEIVKKSTGSKSEFTNDAAQKEMKIEEELQTLRDEHANIKAMMEEKIKEKNEKIVALEESNDSLQKPALQVPILKRQAKVRNKDIQKLQNDIKTRDSRIQELQSRIRELEATDRAAQLEAKDREIKRLTESIEDLLNKLKAQDELISSGNGDLLQGGRQ